MDLRITLIFIFVFSFNSTAACNLSSYESPRTETSLIELYTSEGCSSCPPADRWVNNLIKEKELWTKFVPIKFHVTYWDYLGWKDKLAKPEYTMRQRSYVKAWQGSVIYTPGFVLNGREWRTFFSRSLPISNMPAGALKANRKRNKLIVKYLPIRASKDLSFSVAILENGITHKVRRGENRGRTLNHNFVVRNLFERRVSRTKDYYETTFMIPSNYLESDKDFSLALWVSDRQTRRVYQATGGCLN